MPTRDITCLNCGCSGMLDVHHATDDTPKNQLFKHLGHNPYSGDLHYQCPACGIVLLVDPVAALGNISLKGIPGRHADILSRQGNNSSVWRDLFQSFAKKRLGHSF